MQCTADSIESALRQFKLLRDCSPYRFSGQWYIVAGIKTYQAFRTKRAALHHEGVIYSVRL